MKLHEKNKAIELRNKGYSIRTIAKTLNVAKSSVSIWVRNVKLSNDQLNHLAQNGYTTEAIEKRRQARLKNEQTKRQLVIDNARKEIKETTGYELRLMGTMLYWAEGGKTRRLVRFSNGDSKMILIMMKFFREVCEVPEAKFRGYIHIHPHLNHIEAERYWSNISNIPIKQFFKTYRNKNVSSKNKRKTLPYGVLDIYVLDTNLFYKITGWAKEIFNNNQ